MLFSSWWRGLAKRGRRAFRASGQAAGRGRPRPARANPSTHQEGDLFFRPAIELLETRRLLSGSAPSANQLLVNYDQNPLSFEPNVGQTNSQVQFLSQGPGYSLFLNSQEAVLSLQKLPATSAQAAPPSAATVVQMQLVGANLAANGVGLNKLPGVSNYFDGASSKDWLTNVPNYGQVEYQNVYAGINLIYFGNQQQLEFNFQVGPGADPGLITMNFQGVKSLTLDSAGDLVLQTSGGKVIEQAPVAYQEMGGAKQVIAGSFVLQGSNQVGFQVGPYDHSQPLVIDPVVVYSTYLGGSGDDVGSAIAVDSSGNTFVTGYTNSANFPAKPGSLQPTSQGGEETYVTKFDPDGQIIASTYLGGTPTGLQRNFNDASGIGVDKAGNVYITGSAEYDTSAPPFPTTLTPFPTGGTVFAQGAYVAELSPTLNQLVYSTYLGSGISGSSDYSAGIAVDAAGDAYVAGNYEDVLQQVYATGSKTLGLAPFVAQLNPSGGVVFNETINQNSVGTLSSYIGGGSSIGDANGNYAEGIAIDAAGNAYVVGSTDSNTFGSAVAPIVANPAGYDVFVLKVDTNGAQQYLVQLGGIATNATPSDPNYNLGLNFGINSGSAIAVDAAGAVYVTGSTDALDFPTVSPFQSTFKGGTSPLTTGSKIVSSNGTSAFVFKLNPAGTQLLYSTYLGGSGDGINIQTGFPNSEDDSGNGIAVNGAGDAYVIGSTNSVDFPTLNAVQSNFGQGNQDAFITKLTSAGSGLIYSTFYSGTGADAGTHAPDGTPIEVSAGGLGIALDQYGSAYLTGYTTSGDFPTQNAAQAVFGGGAFIEGGLSFIDQYPPDAIVVKLAGDLTVTAQSVTPNPTVAQPFTALVATFTAPNPTLPASNYTVSITWGDGTSSNTTDIRQPQQGGSYQVYATHTYTTLGVFPIRVNVVDNTYGIHAFSVSDVSQQLGDDNSPSIAVDPTNANNVFEIANTADQAVLASSSHDGGATWTIYAVGGTDTSTSVLYPSAVFDKFGNLYVADLLEDQSTGQDFVQIALSADAGATFRQLVVFPLAGITGAAGLTGNQNFELRPSLATGPAGAGGPPGAASLWVLFFVPGQSAAYYVAAAAVTGKAWDDLDSNGVIGIFTQTEVASALFGSTGDLAVGPLGQVTVVWQNVYNNGTTTPYPQGAFLVSTNSSGLQDVTDFSPPQVLTPTPTLFKSFNIPAQDEQMLTVDPQLVWDVGSDPHGGRLYLVYADEQTSGGDTFIYERYSDDSGTDWSAPVQVSNNPKGPTGYDYFLPSASLDPGDGELAVGFYQAQDSGNLLASFDASMSDDGGQSFSSFQVISPGLSNVAGSYTEGNLSTSVYNPPSGVGTQFGTRTGLAFIYGVLYSAWTDDSSTLLYNPEPPAGDGIDISTNIAEGQSGIATVVASPPLVTGLPVAATESQSFSGMVATFIDTDSALMATDFTAIINWGDGTSASGAITASGAADNHFIIRGSHTYATAGTYIVTVTVHDAVNDLNGTTASDVSQMPGDQSEPSIAIDPNNLNRLFAVSNEEGTGLFAAVSSDGGVTWSARTMADGSDGLPVAFCDPKAAFDQFGNLFLTYLDPTGTTVIVALSTDGGQSFTSLDTFYDPTGVDQPTVATGPGVGGKGSAVWETFLEGTQIVATGASVTGLGLIGSFSLEQVATGPADGTTRNFGDVVVGPSGQVLIDYQTPSLGLGPSTVYVNLDVNGPSPGGFGAPVLVTSTQVGGFDPIPPEQVRTIGAEANLAWDRSSSPHNGRVYLAYTDASAPGNQDTKIFLRYSDDNGMTWSAPVAVSDDKTNSSEFLPSIAVDQSDGDVVVAWYDARNDPNDVKTQFFAAVSSDGGQTFSPSIPVGVGMSDATAEGLNSFSQRNQYGDYTGVAFAGGILYPAWTDNSPDLPGNPDLPNFDIAVARPAVAHVADQPLTAKPLDISAQAKDEGGEFTAALATFTDADPNGQLSYDTATINWGDPDPNTGAPDTTSGTITESGGVFTVTGTHAYMAASSYTITITIQDKGGASASVTTAALVQDAPLNPGTDVNLTARAGQPWTGIVGTLTDTDPNGAPDDYATTIDWGDQQQSSGLVVFDGSAALTYDSSSGLLYTFGNNDQDPNNAPYLISISGQGAVTPLAPVDSTFHGGLAYDPNNGDLYALSNAASGLSTLMICNDFSTPTFSPVAVLGSGFTGGLAFNSADGNLYAIAGASGSWDIDRIAPATGVVTALASLAPSGNQPPIRYTGLSFYTDGNAYAVGNDSDGNSTLYRITLGGSVTTTALFPLGSDLTTPPSTQEGFTGGLAYEPTGAPGGLGGDLLGVSGDGSGTSYLNTISLDGTTASAFEVYVPAPAGQIKPASGDFSNGFDIIGTHTYAQVMTASLTVSITDVEPSQVPGSVVRSTATDGGTVIVLPPAPQPQPPPPAFTAFQGYPTGSLALASFTVSGGASTTPGFYTATIDWNDRSVVVSGTVVIDGSTITVSGTHTYINPGDVQPVVVLEDALGDSVSASAAVTVAADLTALPAPTAFTVFAGDATGSLTLATFSIPAGLPGAGMGSYTATINWQDGTATDQGTVQLIGTTLAVSGSHTFATAGAFQPTITLQDNTGGSSATVTDAVTVLADVTAQVHAVSSGLIYNPSTQLFNGNVTITNAGTTTLTGPFPLVFQGLPAGVTLADAIGTTGAGAPYVSDDLATLPPGQSSTTAVQFKDPQFASITYTLQVLDPPPSNPVQLVSGIDPSLISATAFGGVDQSGGVSMSADGRYVVFAAGAYNLTSFGATTPNGGEQVFVRDTVTGTTTLVSVNSSGTGYGGPPSLSPVISPNGRYVAFLSEAGNLVSGGTAPAGFAIFVRDLQAGTTTEVSVTNDIPMFSGNSQFLVFESTQTNLVSNDTTPGQLFEYNLQTGTTTMVSVDTAGTDGGNFVPNGNTSSIIPYNPSVSADGRFIVFQSQSTDLVANDSVSGIQLFVRDKQQGTTTLITAQPGNYFPQISADGSTVVFTSGLASLVSGVSGTQLYAYDVQTQTTSLVSVDAPGFGGGSAFGSGGGAYQPAITPDGRYVAYTFVAPGGYQVYVRDLQSDTTVLVSAGLNGGNGNLGPFTPGESGTPLISADGRYVVFESDDTNLVANDAAGNGQLFERDLQLGTTTLVTVNDTGTNAGNGPPQAYDDFCMSQDGDYVAFISASSDLVPNDYNGGADDVFERNTPAQFTLLVSAADPELPDVTGSTENISTNPSVSADGRYVAFSSDSAQLVTNVPTGGSQIYVRDLQSQTTNLVSIDPTGTSKGNNISANPVISADGRFVLFESTATNLVANDNVTGLQLYIRDLQTGITSLVSVPLTGTNGGNQTFYQAEISTNDRYVVFQSTAAELVANDAAGGCQVYIRDLQEGTTSLVSVDSAGTNGADNASFADEYLPEISADGQYVAFQSFSDNLVAGEAPFPGLTNVFERDLQTGVTSLVSVNETGTASYGSSNLEAMTPDGRYVVFTSGAGDLAANAPHGGIFERDLQQGTTTLVSVGNAIAQSVSSDGRFITFSDGSGIYVRDMETATTSLVSVEQDGTGISNGISQYSSISANGRFVLFQSTSTNLVSATIASGTTQLYVRDLRTGITKLVSIAPDGTQSADQSTEDVALDSALFSTDGSTVVFETGADNLVPDFIGSTSLIFTYSTASFTVPAGVLQVSASPIHAVEGTSFTGMFATFTDTDGDPIGNYTATIDWGDGSTSAGAITANADGSFNVTGTHTFAEYGFYPIDITVLDSDGSTASASTTVVETSPGGDVTYPIEIDTSALNGTTGSIALQFNPGSTPNAQAAAVTVSNFRVTGGSLSSATTEQGGASGSLADTLTIVNSAVLNEITQGFLFGEEISFDITLSGAALEQPGNGEFGSTFAVQLLAADGMTPQSTIDPSGAPLALDVNPDGSTAVMNFPSSAQGGTPIAGAYDVADAPLQAAGTTLSPAAGTAFSGVVATFTDGNPNAPISDYQAPTITWGDGATSPGTITTGTNGVLDITGSHTYSAAGVYTASVTIVDFGGSSATATTPVTVVPALIEQAPAITSANQVTFTVGSAGSFTITTTGIPAAALTVTGTLPGGVIFTDDGNGVGTLAGTPAAGRAGTYELTVAASNGTQPDATQEFTLTVLPVVSNVTGTGSGILFIDYKTSGTINSIDPPLPGVTVYASTSAGAPLQSGDPQALTGSDGSYTLAGLAAGTQTINLDYIPNHGLLITAPANGSATVTVTSGATTVLNIGCVPISQVVPVAVAGSPIPSSDNQLTAYVTGIYENVLGRTPDSAGLQFWSSELQASTNPSTARLAFVTAIWDSPEHRRLEVGQFYETFLNRQADTAGLTYWVNQLMNGAGEADVSLRFVLSPEFRQQYATPDAYVQALFGDVLSRNIDQGSLSYWENVLQSSGAWAVADDIITSNESFERMVDSFYIAYLHRPGETAGVNYWLDLLFSDRISGMEAGSTSSLAAGADSPAGVAEQFLAGDSRIMEYFNDAGSA